VTQKNLTGLAVILSIIIGACGSVVFAFIALVDYFGWMAPVIIAGVLVAVVMFPLFVLKMAEWMVRK